MRATIRVLIFGVISGVLWSAVAGGLGSLFGSAKETATVVASGLASGVLTSLALRSYLAGAGIRATLIAGAISLPLGAFLFGFSLSILQWAVCAQEPAPFEMGMACALVSMISIFTILLWPLAILTTFIFRAVISAGKGRGHEA